MKTPEEIARSIVEEYDDPDLNPELVATIAAAIREARNSRVGDENIIKSNLELAHDICFRVLHPKSQYLGEMIEEIKAALDLVSSRNK